MVSGSQPRFREKCLSVCYSNMANGFAPSYEDFLALGTNCLVDYLAVRGLKVSGTRVELVARAFAAAELNLPITESTKEQQNRPKLEYENV